MEPWWQKHGANNYLPLFEGAQEEVLGYKSAMFIQKKKFYFFTFLFFLGFEHEAEANKRLACHNESRGPVSWSKCEYILSHIHLLNKARCGWRRKTSWHAIWLPPLKLSLDLGEKERQCLAQHGFIFFWSEHQGPQRDTKTDLHATCYSPLPAANLLLWQVSFPNSNLEDFSNLNGICRRSEDTSKSHCTYTLRKRKSCIKK